MDVSENDPAGGENFYPFFGRFRKWFRRSWKILSYFNRFTVRDALWQYSGFWLIWTLTYMDKSGFRVACLFWLIWTLTYMDKSKVRKKSCFFWLIWTVLVALATIFFENRRFFWLIWTFWPRQRPFFLQNRGFFWLI